MAVLAGALALTGCTGSTIAGSGRPASTPASAASTAPTPTTGAQSSGASSTPTSTTPTPTPTTTTSASAGLRTVVVTAHDLPATWEASAYQPDSSEAAASAALAACTGEKNTDPDRTQTVHSDVFTLGASTVSSEASRYRSQSDITSDLAVLKNPKFAACYRSLVRKELTGTGGTTGTVSLTVTRSPAGYPNNVAATLDGRVEVTANGTMATVYVTAVLITGSRLEAEADFVGLGAPVPAQLRIKVGTALAVRARRV